MMHLPEISKELTVWLGGGTIIFVWFALLLPFKRFVLSRVRKRLAKNSIVWDDILIEALQFPLTLLIICGAFVLAKNLLPISAHANQTFHVINTVLVTLAGVLVLSKLSIGWLARSEEKNIELKHYSGMARGGIRAVLFALGAMLVMDSLGISITPLIASLGVGSVAVALALQDTLANFFSGIYVLVDKPIKTGDYIEIEGGIRGYVEKVSIRTTHIRILSNNIVIVPNTKIASSILTNYTKPVHEQSVYISVGVHYDSDLEKVEQITKEVAKQTMTEVEGGVKNFEPLIRFNEFADSSINFTVIMRGQEFVSQYLLKHEFIKNLHERYKQENIEIPFPMRTVIMQNKD
jgi:small-conductance mechanosensitive channel